MANHTHAYAGISADYFLAPNSAMASTGVIARLDVQERLQLPRSMLDELGWKADTGPLPLLVEIVEAGRIRLLDVSNKSRLNALFERHKADVDGNPDSSMVLRALEDRYRDAHLLKGEPRVRLPKVVIAALLPETRLPIVEPVDIYVELLGKCGVEASSPSARLRRLERLGASISIWTTEAE